jgi:hypothetical protein
MSCERHVKPVFGHLGQLWRLREANLVDFSMYDGVKKNQDRRKQRA